MNPLPEIFAALSDPTRFAIVERLLQEDELPAGAFREDFDISAPAISRHLAVLTRVGLVERRVAAQRRLYRARPEAIQAISAWTMSHKDFWEGSLRRLEAALAREMNRK